METSKYLIPAKIEKEGKNKSDINFRNAVTVYDTGFWKKAPNPRNKKICEETEQQLKMGFFIGERVYYLSDKQLDDPNFSN
jgi:hypothetical protein